MTNGIAIGKLTRFDMDVLACLGRLPKLPSEIAEELTTSGPIFGKGGPTSGDGVRHSLRRIREALKHNGMIDGLEVEHESNGKPGQTLRYSLSAAALRWVHMRLY